MSTDRNGVLSACVTRPKQSSRPIAMSNMASSIGSQYFQAVAAFPQVAVPGSNVKEMISFINDSGFGAIGTPDMVTAQIDRLMTQSNGGFGAYLMLAHNWADPRATQRSYELIARHVMPHFQ